MWLLNRVIFLKGIFSIVMGDFVRIPTHKFHMQGAIYWIIALVFVYLSLRWAKNELNEEKLPLVRYWRPVSLHSSLSTFRFQWGQAGTL